MKRTFSGIVLVLLMLAAFSASAELIDSYPTYEEMVAEIYALRDADPDRVELIEYGKSVEGRPLLALRLHLGDGEARPGALVAGNIHGEEWIGNRTAMAVARRVVSGMDSDSWIRGLLAKMDIYVAPCLNPDGYFRTWNSGGNDKLGEMRKNANSVDLNRNFPPPGKKRPEGKVESTGYPGEVPFSEPETRAIATLVIERGIFATVDYHSVMGTIVTPGCKTSECRSRFKAMVKAYRSNQEHTKYLGPVTPAWMETPGMMEPYLYYHYGVMSILIELGIQSVNAVQNRSLGVFEVFNPKDHQRWTDNEVDATLKALEQACQLTGGKPIPEELR